MCASVGHGDNDYSVHVFTGQFAEVNLDRRTVVPRYLDDPAPGGPIEWAQMFSPHPVPDAELQRQAASLRVLLTT
jgi:hypothetical protein